MEQSRLKMKLASLSLTISTDPVKSGGSPDLVMEDSFHDIYRIVNKIGEGAHSLVFKVQQKKTGALFAAKQFRTTDEEMIQLIKKTYSIQLMTNDSDYFLKTYDLFIDQVRGEHFLLSEYSHLPTLENSIGEQLSQRKQMIIIKNLAEAINYLHAKRICHRDIKPDNILINIDTGDIKLIDFGVAKIFKKKESNMMTPTGNFKYRAPEVFDNSTYDQSIDIWALGVVAFQMNQHKKMLTEIVTQEDLKKIKPKNLLIQMMLEPDPKNRADAPNIVEFLTKQLLLYDNRKNQSLCSANQSSNRSISYDSPEEKLETKNLNKGKKVLSDIYSYKDLGQQRSLSKISLQSKIRTSKQLFSPLPIQLISSTSSTEDDYEY